MSQVVKYEYFSYSLEPISRVSVGRGSEVRFVKRMQEVIPGSSVRGALGAAWWSPLDPGFGTNNTQEVFDRIFGTDLQVRQAVPTMEGVPARLRFMSERFCKYEHDFVEDAALVASPAASCPDCGSPLVPGKGWKVPSEWFGRVTTTALTDRGVADDQRLFSREVFKKDVGFVGTIRVAADSPHVELVRKWLQVPRRISVGGKKSVLGRVEMTVSPIDPPHFHVFDSDAVVVRLKSPAIVVDEWGFPSVELQEWLRGHTKQGEVLQAWVRPAKVSGWNSVANMPKPTEWVIQAGGVALLSGWTKPELKRLAQGIGLRQNEGFGEVELCAAPSGGGSKQ